MIYKLILAVLLFTSSSYGWNLRERLLSVDDI